MISKVNSETEIEALLDSDGQLRLRTPLNIFIGGQILDRGITIKNLVGFYYGRRPNRFQQDTVLQHSRMYGSRPPEDLAITRFYTTQLIYDSMRRINEMDTAMREAIESGHQDVVFLHSDQTGRVIPCSPNKILASTTITLRPFSRVLPFGFQSGLKNHTKKTMEELDNLIGLSNSEGDLMPVRIATTILHHIFETYLLDDEYSGIRCDEMTNILSYLADLAPDPTRKGHIITIVRTNRRMRRVKEDGRFQNYPETADEEGRLAKQFATDIPSLILLRHAGNLEDGWNGTPFWWPVLYAPRITPSVIYSRETALDE